MEVVIILMFIGTMLLGIVLFEDTIDQCEEADISAETVSIEPVEYVYYSSKKDHLLITPIMAPEFHTVDGPEPYEYIGEL